jgi:hypothetical protein
VHRAAWNQQGAFSLGEGIAEHQPTETGPERIAKGRAAGEDRPSAGIDDSKAAHGGWAALAAVKDLNRGRTEDDDEHCREDEEHQRNDHLNRCFLRGLLRPLLSLRS